MAAVWYAWKGYYDGKALSLGELEQGEASTLGFHGYSTAAAAEANPNTVPSWNLLAKAQVNSWVYNAEGDLTTHVAAAASTAAGQAASSAGSDAGSDIVSFFSQGAIWVRVAEVAAGLILLYVGFRAVTATPPVTVKEAAPTGKTTKGDQS